MSQAQQLTLASRAFSTDCLGEFAQYVTEYFGYDRVLPMVRAVYPHYIMGCLLLFVAVVC